MASPSLVLNKFQGEVKLHWLQRDHSKARDRKKAILLESSFGESMGIGSQGHIGIGS